MLRASRPTRLLLTAFLIGLLLSTAAAWLHFQGFFIRWQPLAPAPPHTTRILNSSPWGLITVQDYAGQVWACDPNAADCWIPWVAEDGPAAQPCARAWPSFWPLHGAPHSPPVCASFDGRSIETVYLSLAAVDPSGMLWRWDRDNHGLMILVYAGLIPVGGVLAAALAALGWLAARLSSQKDSSRPGVSPAQVSLLAIPWLILAGVGLFFYTAFYRPAPAEDPAANVIYTAAAQTVQAELTVEAQQVQALGTPAPAGGLIERICQAEWSTGGDRLDCGAADSAVRQLENTILPGPAIAVPADRPVTGTFPPVTIRPGDHFRAAVTCLDTAAPCDTRFTLMAEGDRFRALLGAWRVGETGPMTLIDIDVSRLAGQPVRLVLITSGGGWLSNSSVWVEPRIGP